MPAPDQECGQELDGPDAHHEPAPRVQIAEDVGIPRDEERELETSAMPQMMLRTKPGASMIAAIMTQPAPFLLARQIRAWSTRDELQV